jgi:alcohol dehydrogenase
MSEPVTPFHAQLPVRIAFGDNVLAELPDALTALGATTALVVVEEPVAGHPSVVAALTAAEGAGLRLDRAVKGPGEPTFALADELAGRVRDGRLDAVVGIGGGSALDVAKAARIAADQGGAVSEYAAGARVPQPPRIGLVLCPTTAGTGSEVSGASVLTDTDADRKVGFGHPNMRAQHALVDPILTHGLPAAPTAHSGVDALAQAIGACTVRNSSPLSVAFGLEACHHVAHALRQAVADGSDAEARRRMACASLTAGLAMNLSDCAADHALAQALGSVSHLPHGLTVGLVVAETLERSRGDCADRLERVADALGEPSDGTTDGSRAVRAVRRVLADVGFPTLAETGVAEDALPALVASATGEQSYNLQIDCHAWSEAEVEQAFRAAFALTAR